MNPILRNIMPEFSELRHFYFPPAFPKRASLYSGGLVSSAMTPSFSAWRLSVLLRSMRLRLLAFWRMAFPSTRVTLRLIADRSQVQVLPPQAYIGKFRSEICRCFLLPDVSKHTTETPETHMSKGIYAGGLYVPKKHIWSCLNSRSFTLGGGYAQRSFGYVFPGNGPERSLETLERRAGSQAVQRMPGTPWKGLRYG